MKKNTTFTWLAKTGALAVSLALSAAAIADGWLYEYQAPESTAIDSPARVPFLPKAITQLNTGFVVAGTRIQDGSFSGSPVYVRYDENAEIQSVLPGKQTAMLFSGPDDVLVALDDHGISAQAKNGTPLYHWRYEFPTGAISTQVQADASGNALVLRGGRAFAVSRLGIFDLGSASAIAADASALYVARTSASGTKIAQVAQDGSSAREFDLEPGADVLAFTVEPSNLLALVANAGQVVTQRYSRADFSIGTRRNVVLATPYADLIALSQRFSAPLATDLSWRALLAGEGTPQLFIFDQLGARFITLPLNVPCTADCRWQSTRTGESIYSVERLGDGTPGRQTVVLDGSGNAVDFSSDVVDSVHSVTRFAGGRVLASGGELIAISNEYVSTRLDQAVPASLRSVALLDDQGNSIAIGINADLGLARHSYVNTQGARIWEQEFALPLSGVATATENAERYCTAMALTDKRIDVRCLDKRSGGLIEFETLGTVSGGSSATPRRLLSSLSVDHRLALWIERGEDLSNRTIEYRELSPTVRIVRESVVATQIQSTAAELLLAGRVHGSGSELLYVSNAGITLRRDGQDHPFGAGGFASFMPDGGLSLALNAPLRLQRLNADLSLRYTQNASAVRQALSVGTQDIYRSDTRLFAVDRTGGTLLWDQSGDFANAELIASGDRLLVVRTRDDKISLQQRSLSTGLPLAERVFPCTAPCRINAARWRAEQLRIQLDQHSDLGTRMSINAIDAPNSVPALSLSHPSLIGTWANPTLTGQSLVINRIPNSNLIFAGWNTQSLSVSQARDASSLRWYVLLGEIAPLSVAELGIPIYQSSGGKFQTSMPAPETKAVGKAFLRLSGCDQLIMRYDFEDNAMDGEILLQRAIPATYPCLGLPASAATAADAKVPLNTHSDWEGGWYDPATPGQGFFFNDTRISAGGSAGTAYDLLHGSWQVFDALSNDPNNQHWFTLSANRGNNQLSAEVKIIQSAGGLFGKQAAGGEVQVGAGNISRIDCERLLFQYRFDASVGQYSQKEGQIILRKLGGCAR